MIYLFIEQLKKTRQLFYFAWFNFAVRYRKTFMGPLWIIVGPSLFIATLGLLFSRLNDADQALFIPHMAIGLVVWTLISGFVNTSTKIFQRNRAYIMQGNMSLVDITMVEVFLTILQFLHQLIILFVVFVLFNISFSIYSLVSILGLAVLIVNGIWLSIFFGIIGARYRDLPEIVDAIMRIAFLATPIIWMPGVGARGGVIDGFLYLNPFYHFLELIRAPLLNQQISLVSLSITLALTLIGSVLAYTFHNRFAKLVPLWI